MSDPAEQRVLDDIAKFGWHLIQINAGEAQPGFVYSIGMMESLGHPEIIMFGLARRLVGTARYLEPSRLPGAQIAYERDAGPGLAYLLERFKSTDQLAVRNHIMRSRRSSFRVCLLESVSALLDSQWFPFNSPMERIAGLPPKLTNAIFI